MSAPALEWTLWKRNLYFSNATRLPASNSNTDTLFEIPHGTFPIVEEPAKLAMRIVRFQCPMLFGTFHQEYSPPGSTFVVREYLSGELRRTTEINIFEGTPDEIPYWFCNGIQLADRLNMLFSKLRHKYVVSYDISTAFMRYATTTENATFEFDFYDTTNPCPLALGFERNTITGRGDVLFSYEPVLSQGFLNIDIRFPQLSGGIYSDNDASLPLHASNVFGRVPIGKYKGLTWISQEFDTYNIINGRTSVFDGGQFNILLTTERPGEEIPLPVGQHWNIEIEFLCYIPAYVGLLGLLKPKMVEDTRMLEDKKPDKPTI